MITIIILIYNYSKGDKIAEVAKKHNYYYRNIFSISHMHMAMECVATMFSS